MKSRIASQVATFAMTLLISGVPTLGAPASPAPTDTAPTVSAPAAQPEPADSTVVSKVSIEGKTFQVTYGQVKSKLKLLPPQLQKAPLNDIFPLLQKSVATETVVAYLAEKAGLKSNPDYQKMVVECQNGVLQKLFLDLEIKKRATDDELKKAYEEVKAAAPKEDEYNISIITVTDKKKAQDLLKKVTVSNFAELADTESSNKIPRGNLGYIRLSDVPEAFRNAIKGAAKATIIQKALEVSMPDPNDASKKVATYNLIFIQDKRPATFPPFEAVKEELTGAIGPKLAKAAIADFEKGAQIEHFAMDGKPLPAEQKADAPKADAKVAG